MDRPTLRHGNAASVAAELERRARNGEHTFITDLQLALANALDRIAKLEDRLRVMQQAQQVAPIKFPINSDIHDD